jgi:hypothetical protein
VFSKLINSENMRGYRRKSGRHSSVESFSIKSCSPDRSNEDVMLISSDEERNNEESPLRINRKRPLSSSSSEYSQNNSPSPALSSTPPRSVSDFLTRNGIEYSDWDIDRMDKDMTRIHDDMSCNSEVSTELSDNDDDLVYVDDFSIDHKSAPAGELTEAQLHDMVTGNRKLTSASAIELLHKGFSLDWASNRLEYYPISYDDDNKPYDLWKCDNFLDYMSIEGVSFKAVSKPNCSIIDLTTFTFDKWYMQYRNTKSGLNTSGVSFGTFHFAYSGRLQYFLVFKKTVGDQQPRQNKSMSIITAIAKQHAVELSNYMIRIFTKFDSLIRFGVNQQSWSLLNQFKKSVDLDPSAFSLFQTEFFAGWKNFANSGSKYWVDMIPRIDIYSYGGNQVLSPTCQSYPYQYIIDDFNRNYNANNISTISLAIASQLSLSQHYPLDEKDRHGNDYGVDLSLLASTEAVVGQYSSNNSKSGLRIFPAMFSPVVCNWQSKTIPKFYHDLTRPIVQKIERDNVGVEVPLSFLSFQGYSAVQKQIHSDSSSFVLGQSNYAAGHCITGKWLNGRNLVRLKKVKKITASQHPFNTVVEGLKTVQDSGSISYRFEPIISICLSSLGPENRNFEYIVREIIVPLLDIWPENARTIGNGLLLPFNKSVR